MKRYIPTYTLVLTCLIFITINFQAISQVGIGTIIPNESSILDITSETSGILIPRVSLSSTTDVTSVNGTEEVSLLLYNTSTISDVTPGFYYWNGTKWVRLIDEPVDWSTSGNSNIDPTKFFGTTTNQDIIFKTNNINRMTLNSPEGQLTIGENIGGSSTNDLLKVSSDIEIGGGIDYFDGDFESMLLRGQSEDWFIAVANSPTLAESNFSIFNKSSSITEPPFLISQRNLVAVGGDDDSPNDILHVVKDQNATTAIRIDNDDSSTSRIHTALRLYDGSNMKGIFQHNNVTNTLQIGHPAERGVVELISGGNKAMTLENNSSVTIEKSINIKPGTAPALPNEGDVYYDASAHKLRLYDGSNWVDLN